MAPSQPPEVVLENLSKSFGGKVVLAGIDLTIRSGEMVAIVGGYRVGEKKNRCIARCQPVANKTDQRASHEYHHQG